jgi:hypothetical protein
MIALSVKNLQELLMNNRGISQNCFNLGVCFQVAREYITLKQYNSIMKYHMDLSFCLSTFFIIIIVLYYIVLFIVLLII